MLLSSQYLLDLESAKMSKISYPLEGINQSTLADEI